MNAKAREARPDRHALRAARRPRRGGSRTRARADVTRLARRRDARIPIWRRSSGSRTTRSRVAARCTPGTTCSAVSAACSASRRVTPRRGLVAGGGLQRQRRHDLRDDPRQPDEVAAKRRSRRAARWGLSRYRTVRSISADRIYVRARSATDALRSRSSPHSRCAQPVRVGRAAGRARRRADRRVAAGRTRARCSARSRSGPASAWWPAARSSPRARSTDRVSPAGRVGTRRAPFITHSSFFT